MVFSGWCLGAYPGMAISVRDVSLLTSFLNGLVLDPSHDDKWVLSLESSGKFTVKSLSLDIKKKLLVYDVTHGIYQLLLFLIPYNQDCLDEDLELVECSGSFNPSLDAILKGISDFSEDTRASKNFHAVCLTVIWHVWAWRNKIFHASTIEEATSARNGDIIYDVQRLSLLWIFNRDPFSSHSWDLWIHNSNVLGLS
ncbi:hypothetical protein Tco_1560803 [Tanacetum coccineum]